MTAYLVTFFRIGRNHAAKPLIADVDGPNHLAERIGYHARPYLASRCVDAVVDLEAMNGHVLVGGFRNAGDFTIAEASPDGAAA